MCSPYLNTFREWKKTKKNEDSDKSFNCLVFSNHLFALSRSLQCTHSNCQHIPDSVPKVDVGCETTPCLQVVYSTSRGWSANQSAVVWRWIMSPRPSEEKLLCLDFKLSRVSSPSVTAVWKAACVDLPLQFQCLCRLQRCQGKIYRYIQKHCVINKEVTVWFQ